MHEAYVNPRARCQGVPSVAGASSHAPVPRRRRRLDKRCRCLRGRRVDACRRSTASAADVVLVQYDAGDADEGMARRQRAGAGRRVQAELFREGRQAPAEADRRAAVEARAGFDRGRPVAGGRGRRHLPEEPGLLVRDVQRVAEIAEPRGIRATAPSLAASRVGRHAFGNGDCTSMSPPPAPRTHQSRAVPPRDALEPSTNDVVGSTVTMNAGSNELGADVQ